ncbi:IclR family transcriptional regulator [Alicyclobacillus fastidiosus]|uniref:IclR family transcriptional regulator n=1 Tax=Alicyclobacillus fastidiosus TaxID=392011 RepID=A0ABV5AC87_9BACL|nr:IclR family transcriptional regulator [Alicyclobacillus fastidiosus]WEH11469.1 IclR family transcriptional regulator [Alicyclobacillus fastidiosus]
MESIEKKGYLSSVKNALRILNSFSVDAPQKRVTDLADEFGLSKSTVSRLMIVLAEEGFVIKDSESQFYQLGFSFLRLSNVIKETVTLRKQAYPIMQKMVNEIDHSSHLVVLQGTEVFYLTTIQCRHPVRISAPEGVRNPAYCTSSGKLLLSYAEDDTVQKVIARGMTQFTPHTITDPDEFRNHLKSIRSQGYVTSFEEFVEGVVTIGAPIRDFTGKVVAAITIVGPIQRIHFHNIQTYIKKLIETADEISRKIGYNA